MSTPLGDEAGNTTDTSRPLRTYELWKGKPDRHTFLTLPRMPWHLVLDGLTSAANVGSILRLADAVGVELCAHSIPLADLRPPAVMAIVVGNESQGVSRAALALCEEVTVLPMLGQCNSINVSNALVAVACRAPSQIAGSRP
jgi:tRNA G18 (ribose-2'-O)-methylase SpoU